MAKYLQLCFICAISHESGESCVVISNLIIQTTWEIYPKYLPSIKLLDRHIFKQQDKQTKMLTSTLILLTCYTHLKCSSFIFQQIYNAHNLTKHNAWNIIRWWLSGECKAHLADNQTEKIERWLGQHGSNITTKTIVFQVGTMQYAIIFHIDGLLYHNTTRSNINTSHMVFWYVIILQFTLKAFHQSMLHHVFM